MAVTVTVPVAVALQLFVFVQVAVYVYDPTADGVTVIVVPLAVAAPDQTTVPTQPVAVKVAVPSKHMVLESTATVGFGFTVTDVVPVIEQVLPLTDLIVTVTVYVVFDCTLKFVTLSPVPVKPFEPTQLYEIGVHDADFEAASRVAFNATLPPAQITVGFAVAVTLAIGVAAPTLKLLSP